MNCMVCGRKTEHADLVLGPFCSDGHFKRLLEEERQLHAEILAEPAGVMPDAFCVADFERLALKIALLILEALPPEEKAKQQRHGRWIMPPSQMALGIKAKVLDYIPEGYLSCFPLEGAARLFVSQTYRFRKKIPRTVVRAALEKAELLQVLE